MRDGGNVYEESKWCDEPTLFCSHGRPGRNRDIYRGHSRVGSGSPWMLWMPLHMDFDGIKLEWWKEEQERRGRTYSANCEVTVLF